MRMVTNKLIARGPDVQSSRLWGCAHYNLLFGEAGRIDANTNERVLSVKWVTSLCAVIAKSHSASLTNVSSVKHFRGRERTKLLIVPL